MEKSKSYAASDVYSAKNILYMFFSTGNEKILKAIEFSLAGEIREHLVFNLAFGNYNIVNNAIIDDVISDNGDVFIVFNTILSTAKKFLEENPGAIIMVRGSDSSEHFENKCRITCTRKCKKECKKKHQRINIYRRYIEKNFSHLQWEYELYGSYFHEHEEFMLENYRVGAEYLSLFITKR